MKNIRGMFMVIFVLVVLLMLSPIVVHARFIQPDPTIPDVYNPQQLNRYSYALNNPYRYVDLDGFEPTQIESGTVEQLVNFVVYTETESAKQGYQNANEVLERVNNVFLNYGEDVAGRQGSSSFIPRYVYTEKGIVDLKHFFANAQGRQENSGFALALGGYALETFQSIFERDSGFSYEDLFSNKKGREFGALFDNEQKLSTQLETYFSNIGASNFPSNVYNSLPKSSKNTGGLGKGERRFSSGRGRPLTWSQMFSRIVRSLFGSSSSSSSSSSGGSSSGSSSSS